MARGPRAAFRRPFETWNPLTGCTKISPGCKHCYAERIARRLQAIGAPKYAGGFALTLHEHLLDVPFRWKQPRMIFVNSMSDLFHKDVPEEFIHRVFQVMRRADRHLFMVLTKRAEQLEELDPRLDWAPNVWMGVTVENERYAWRIDRLRATGAAVKFLSLEPLLGPLPNLDLRGMHWALVGGETGKGARPMREEWAADIRDQCLRAGVPFRFHRWGGETPRPDDRLLQGRAWSQRPLAYDRPPPGPQLSLFP